MVAAAPNVNRYIESRPSLVERSAFESLPGLFLAWAAAPDTWKTIAAILAVGAVALSFVVPVVRAVTGRSSPVWPVTKRPAELRVTGPVKDNLPGVERAAWFIMAAVAVVLLGTVVWIIQRDSYYLFLAAAGLWIVGSIIQAVYVYAAESDVISGRRS